MIASGGMGVVYLGERTDDAFHKDVAVKLLRPGIAGPDLLARFRTERQVLADLEHPGIARLIDGGSTADGLPFLVMEYVDGITIDRYCDERRLG
ncbi:MAG TPA: protein kinase, partial [Myxococcota bacterium]|nr:protein kinase [Myxococcota bacterium]